MYSKLKIYLFYTPLPFIMLIAGAFFFQDAIIKTLVQNPHPQINYAIFVLIAVGAALILVNLRKLMQEAAKLSEFSEAVRRGNDPESLQAIVINSNADIAYVLRMMASSAGRAMSHREQVSIEHELAKAENRLNNRHTLPQHITNLLVGMGLLGTFIGLLATLDDIAALVASFSTLDVTTANPIEVFRILVERMKAPMYSMGIAFSASLFGLLGSIILGFMMVSMRRCMQDVVSFLGSEVAQHIEFALSRDAGSSAQYIAAGSAINALELGQPSGLFGGEVVLSGQRSGDEMRVLLRIEELLAETTRLQESALRNEVAEFAKQRGEFLRVLSQHHESLGHFQTELQRVGVQLSAVTGTIERGVGDLTSHLHDYLSDLIQNAGQQGRDLSVARSLMARMAEDSAETRRLLALTIKRGPSDDQSISMAELATLFETSFQQALERVLCKVATGSPEADRVTA